MRDTPTIERTAHAPLGGAGAWLTTDFLMLLGAAATWSFAFSSFYLLPMFLAEQLAAGPAEIGMVVGILGVSTVLCTLAAGRWIDRIPRNRAITWGALAMGAAAFGFTTVDSLGVVLDVLRIVQGVSYALVLTAVGALIADLVPHERLSQALGLSGSSMLIMNAVAPAVAEPLAVAAGWNAVFLLAGLAALLSAWLAAKIAEPLRTATPSPASVGLLPVLRQPHARQYATIIALAGAAFGAVFAFQQPYALALGRERVGGFFVAYAAAAIVVRVVFGSLPDRFGRYRVACAALVLYALVVLGMAGMRASMLEAFGVAFGVAHGLFYPAMNAIALTATRPDERGRIMAIFTGAFSFGLWIGPTLLGLVAARLGYAPMFVLAAAGIGAAVAILSCSRELRASGAHAR